MEKYTTSIIDGKNVFKCKICGKALKKQNMNEHIESVHEGIKPFKCAICDYSCSQKSSFSTHMAKNHLNVKFVVTKAFVKR